MIPQSSSHFASIKIPSRFVLQNHLGTGGQGNVYRVYDQICGDYIAIKMLNTVSIEAKEALKAEFRALRQLSILGFVEVYELFLDYPVPFFTMEWIEGSPLVSDTDLVDVESPAGRLLLGRFAELAIILDALHQRGKVHRDIKPSNVLVDTQGRVRVLDLGLVRSQGHGKNTGPSVGTFDYMAPEQLGNNAQPAADWYSYGVLLFRALTRQLPFPEIDGFHKKMEVASPSVASLSKMPVALSQLVDALLHINAESRPCIQSILSTFQSLGIAVSPRASLPSLPIPPAIPASLTHTLSQSGFRTFQIIGPTGSGKSELIQSFIANKSSKIMRCRGYPHEHGSHQIFPELVDWATRLLVLISDFPSLLPENARAISIFSSSATRMFDMLPKSALPRGLEVRKKLSETTLLELICTLSRKYNITLVIENVHLLDKESLAFIEQIVARSPPLFLLLTSQHPYHPDWPTVTLQEPNRWDNPAQTENELSKIPESTKKLLFFCAFSLLPVSSDLLLSRAPDAKSASPRKQIKFLLHKNFLKSQYNQSKEELVPYTSALQKYLLSCVREPDKKVVAWEIFERFASSPELDPAQIQLLVRDLDPSQAATYLISLAEEAQKQKLLSLAVVRYKSAINLGYYSSQVYFQLGTCLAKNGQAVEAAQILETSLSKNTKRNYEFADTALLAAEQHFLSGQIPAGLAWMKISLNTYGIHVPVKGRPIYLRAWLLRLWMLIFGYRRESRLVLATEQQNRQANALLASFFMLILIKPSLAEYFSSQYLVLAFRHGDASHLCRALGFEAGMHALLGGVLEFQERRLLKEVFWLADRTGKPADVAWASLVACMCSTAKGEFRQAVESGNRALQVYLNECPGAWNELGILTMYHTVSLAYTGDLAGIEAWHQALSKHAEETRIFANLDLWKLGIPILQVLAADRPGAVLELIERVQSLVNPEKGFSLYKFRMINARMSVFLYLGEAQAAWDFWERVWPEVRSSRFFAFHFIRTEILFLKGRVLLMLFHQGALWVTRELWLVIEELEAIPRPYTKAFALMIKSSMHANKNKDRVEFFLSEAETVFNQNGMFLFQDVCRERQAFHEGDASLVRVRIYKEFQMRGVVDIKKFLGMLLPWSVPDNKAL